MMDDLIYKATPPTLTDGEQTQMLSDNRGNVKVSMASSAPATGAATWTKSVVALTGSSQTLLAANANRKGFAIFNRLANAQLDVDPAGGTVAANTGVALLGGDPPLFI